MKYKISLTNTGLETLEQVRAMTEKMQEAGHDVEYAGYDCMQGYDDDGEPISCPVGDQEWSRYLELASEA